MKKHEKFIYLKIYISWVGTRDRERKKREHKIARCHATKTKTTDRDAPFVEFHGNLTQTKYKNEMSSRVSAYVQQKNGWQKLSSTRTKKKQQPEMSSRFKIEWNPIELIRIEFGVCNQNPHTNVKNSSSHPHIMMMLRFGWLNLMPNLSAGCSDFVIEESPTNRKSEKKREREMKADIGRCLFNIEFSICFAGFAFFFYSLLSAVCCKTSTLLTFFVVVLSCFFLSIFKTGTHFTLPRTFFPQQRKYLYGTTPLMSIEMTFLIAHCGCEFTPVL